MPGLTCPPVDAGEHRSVRVALCTKSTERPTLIVPGRPWLAAEPVHGDAPSARWEVPVTVQRDPDGFDFSGPSVRADRADRHLFLAWGDVPGDGALPLFCGSKLGLAGVDPGLVEEAMRPGRRLVARIRLTGTGGKPALTWSAGPADAEPGQSADQVVEPGRRADPARPPPRS